MKPFISNFQTSLLKWNSSNVLNLFHLDYMIANVKYSWQFSKRFKKMGFAFFYFPMGPIGKISHDIYYNASGIRKSDYHTCSNNQTLCRAAHKKLINWKPICIHVLLKWWLFVNSKFSYNYTGLNCRHNNPNQIFIIPNSSKYHW